ncbi:MAG: hypothetical protein EOP64_00235 [Sphingomonas sp.]|nr:MAG: hypothetical protein EOP64_00235 [Sphingomonas sp.]
MSGFECFGSAMGFLPADQDMSDEKHQFTPVWLGVGTSNTPLRGNAACLKKAVKSGPAPAPAPNQQDSFTLADADITVGKAFGFTLNGTAISHAAAANETGTQILTDLGNKAKAADSALNSAVSAAGGTTTLKLSAKTADAVAYTAIQNLGHTADVPAPAPAVKDSDDGAGEIKGAPLGILQNRPVQGEACSVMIRDVSNCLAGSDWTPGDNIGVDDDGNAVKVDGAGFAIAVEAAVKGDVSTILLLPRAAS